MLAQKVTIGCALEAIASTCEEYWLSTLLFEHHIVLAWKLCDPRIPCDWSHLPIDNKAIRTFYQTLQDPTFTLEDFEFAVSLSTCPDPPTHSPTRPGTPNVVVVCNDDLSGTGRDARMPTNCSDYLTFYEGTAFGSDMQRKQHTRPAYSDRLILYEGTSVGSDLQRSQHQANGSAVQSRGNARPSDVVEFQETSEIPSASRASVTHAESTLMAWIGEFLDQTRCPEHGQNISEDRNADAKHLLERLRNRGWVEEFKSFPDGLPSERDSYLKMLAQAELAMAHDVQCHKSLARFFNFIRPMELRQRQGMLLTCSRVDCNPRVGLF